MRKWRRTNQKIISMYDLLACLDSLGGVWECNTGTPEYYDHGRFVNESWVMGWQLMYVVSRIRRGCLYWPERCGDKEGGER